MTQTTELRSDFAFQIEDCNVIEFMTRIVVGKKRKILY
jgi:hypothetical protein